MMLAVIAGLAVGIAFIILFASFTKPAFTMSDEEFRAKLMTLPEVQAFYEKAAFEELTPTEQLTHDGSSTHVIYSIEKSLYNNNDPGDITKELRLLVTINSFGTTRFDLECGGPISVSWTPTIQSIKSNGCLENPYTLVEP